MVSIITFLLRKLQEMAIEVEDAQHAGGPSTSADTLNLAHFSNRLHIKICINRMQLSSGVSIKLSQKKKKKKGRKI